MSGKYIFDIRIGNGAPYDVNQMFFRQWFYSAYSSGITFNLVKSYPVVESFGKITISASDRAAFSYPLFCNLKVDIWLPKGNID